MMEVERSKTNPPAAGRIDPDLKDHAPAPPLSGRPAQLGLRGWLRSLEIIMVASLFGLHLYLDLLASTDRVKVRGWFRPLLRLVATRFFEQKGKKKEERQRWQAVWLKKRLLRLGPTFIKIGQAIATRADLLPLAYVKELSKLLDEVPPFDHAQAMSILEHELGAPAGKLFSSIGSRPIAAASLGQVYFATLPGGEEVAVKIQRPRLREIIAFDLRILKRIVRALHRYPKLFRGVDWSGVLDEFASTIIEEMDYVKEAGHAEQFREQFKSWNEVHVPRIYWDLVTPRVLTMEFIHGWKVTDLDHLSRIHMSGAQVNRLLARTYLKQMLEDGFFHADPHPGNLRVMPDGRLAFFDFGMAGRIDAELQGRMIDAFFHILNRDVEGLVEDLIGLGFISGNVDRRSIRPIVQQVFRSYLGLKLSEIRFKELTYELADVVYEYHFRVPARFTYMIRTLLELEGIGVAIDPDFKFVETARPFARSFLFKREARNLGNALVEKLLHGKDGTIDLRQILYLARTAGRMLMERVSNS
ncbi:MAG: AarF/ABC1/UbiB kinase family protein [Acidobacteria bacterium]|nr:AarF/ABC1/UbiB kinase family protein [Acidobacteriota bacterium]